QLLEALRSVDRAEADRAYEAAHSRLSRSVPLLNQRGRFYARDSRHDAAAAAFEQALAIDPENNEAVRGKVRALRMAGRFDDAVAAVEAALNKFPNDYHLLRDGGAIHLARKEYAAAAKCWLALEEHSGHWSLRSEAGDLRRERKFSECQQLIEAA